MKDELAQRRRRIRAGLLRDRTVRRRRLWRLVRPAVVFVAAWIVVCGLLWWVLR